MQNASQSGPGFQERRSATPILMRACKAVPQIAAGALATVAILCVFTVARVEYSDYQTARLQREINAQQAQTEADALAVDHFLQCKHEPTFHSFVNTNADCINRVFDAAQNVTGDQIAGEVTRHLGTWVDKSTRLHALRLEDRHITAYLAKHGFSLVGIAGSLARKAALR